MVVFDVSLHLLLSSPLPLSPVSLGLTLRRTKFILPSMFLGFFFSLVQHFSVSLCVKCDGPLSVAEEGDSFPPCAASASALLHESLLFSPLPSTIKLPLSLLCSACCSPLSLIPLFNTAPHTCVPLIFQTLCFPAARDFCNRFSLFQPN